TPRATGHVRHNPLPIDTKDSDMRISTRLLAALALAAALVLSACGSSGSNGDATRVAGIFSGPTTDADYNQLGLEALKELESNGAEISYSESVEVPDIERVL